MEIVNLVLANQKLTKHIVMVKVKKSFKRKEKARKEREEKLNHAMAELEVESTAHESGFYKRVPKKLSATVLILAFWTMMRVNKNTLRNWAVHAGVQIGESVSKQAIDKRLGNPRMLEMVKSILLKALGKSRKLGKLKGRMLAESEKLGEITGLFNRILLHDSTVQQVPSCLYGELGGNKTSGGPRALMRVQAMYNLCDDCWVDFSADTYRQNDQSQADFHVDKFVEGDLIIRDLGYFVLGVLGRLIKRGVYVITPYQPNVSLFQPDGEKIDLLALLRSNGHVDQPVLVGAEKKIPMRLVANKLSQTRKKKKIAEAKKNKHANTKYSEKYYELLGYEIYLTNIDQAVLDAGQIAKLYGLRWYIEIIFKAWKSYFNFKSIFEKGRMSHRRTMISIYLVLIQFVYLNTCIFQYVKRRVRAGGRYLSILKFMDVVNDLFSDIFSITNLEEIEFILPQFEKHAVYEKRNKYKNMKLKYQYFKELELV